MPPFSIPLHGNLGSRLPVRAAEKSWEELGRVLGIVGWGRG